MERKQLTAKQISAWRSLGWKCEETLTEKGVAELKLLCDMAEECKTALGERDMAIHHLRELVSDHRHVHEGTNALQAAREFLDFVRPTTG